MRNLLFALVIAAAVGCSMEDELNPKEGSPVVITLTESPEVRSSLGDELPSQVKAMRLYAYNAQGHLVDCVSSGQTSATVTLIDGTDYTVYALANFPDLPEAPVEESDFLSAVYPVKYMDMAQSGVPMCGKRILSADELGEGSAEIELTRLITRVSFSLDRSGLNSSDLTVRSVRLRQTASAAAPFAGPFAATDALVEAAGDFASAADIATLNSGGTIWLYCLENYQGLLLPGNVDPWKKVPSELSDAAGSCTYLEVSAAYSGIYESAHVSSDNVTYRFYLGRDNVSDFSLERNHGVDVKLKVSDQGVFDREWKVDYGKSLPVVTAFLGLTPSSTTVYVNQTARLTASYSKYVDGVLASVTDVSSQAQWSVTDASVARINGSTLTGIGAGSVTVTGCYGGYCASCIVNVLPLPGRLDFRTDPVWLYPYKEQNIYFDYTGLSRSDMDIRYFSAGACDVLSVTFMNDNSGYVTVRRGLQDAGKLVYDNPTGGSDAQINLISKYPEVIVEGPGYVLQGVDLCSYSACAVYHWPDGSSSEEDVTRTCTWDVNGVYMGDSLGMGEYENPRIDPQDGDGNIFSSVRNVNCGYNGSVGSKDVLVYVITEYEFECEMTDATRDAEYYEITLYRRVYDAIGVLGGYTGYVDYSWELTLAQGDYYGSGNFTYKRQLNQYMQYINSKQAQLTVTLDGGGSYKEEGMPWGETISLGYHFEMSDFL